MIHILRKNESLSDIAEIYGVEENELAIYNPNAFLCENSCVWVNSGGIVSFSESDGSRNTAPFENHEDVRLSAVHTALSCDDGFVPVDNWGRGLSEIFIDSYRIDPDTKELVLPYDYPAINACIINGLLPSFVITSPVEFCSEEAYNALLTDLSFKEYQNVMITAKNLREYEAAVKLGEVLKNDNFGMNLAFSSRILPKVEDNGLFDMFYYQTEKNIIDFVSFSENILSLTEKFPLLHTGVLYSPGYVDVNKSDGRVIYADGKTAKEIFELSRLSNVKFDDEAQLCYFRYKEKTGTEHTLLFEDMRSFYAKLSFMLEKGVKNICFWGCDEQTCVLSKILGLVK